MVGPITPKGSGATLSWRVISSSNSSGGIISRRVLRIRPNFTNAGPRSSGGEPQQLVLGIPLQLGMEATLDVHPGEPGRDVLQEQVPEPVFGEGPDDLLVAPDALGNHVW